MGENEEETMKERIDTQAFVYHEPGMVRRENRTIKLTSTDLLVKVLASARCGTDKTIYRKGHYKVDANAPIVLGHEFTGEIERVGKEVKTLASGIGYRDGEKLQTEYLDFQEGERVTCQSRIARYSHGLMLLDDPITILSFYIDGAYSQYIKIPKELIQSGSVMRLPDSVGDEEGALVEPAACALESIFATPHQVGINGDGSHQFAGGVKRGGKACVIGSGTVSMIYALLCKIYGSACVYMLVRSDTKAGLVKKILGRDVETVVVEPYDTLELEDKLRKEEEIVRIFQDITAGSLFDDVISACAGPDAQRLMMKLYNPSGYAVGACFGGTHSLVDRVNVDLNHYRCAKTVGTSGCSNRSMERIISLLKEKKLSLQGFTCPDKYSLDSDPDDFFTSQAGGLKPVLYPWG